MMWTKGKGHDLAGEPQKVLQAALRYQGRREYTAFELRKRLRERGAEKEHIEEALDYLQERGYQEDGRSGESHIRHRLAYGPRGRLLIRQELRQRGISSELAERLLEEFYPPEEEQAVLQKLLDREEAPANLSYQERQRLWQKMARRLSAKGFNQSLIIEELSQWMPDYGDEDI